MSVVQRDEPLIRSGDEVVSAGSCFASSLIPYLESAGLRYLRTEARHPDFGDLPGEKYGYDSYSAAYGNIYTPRQLLQLLRRSVGVVKPVEDCWIMDRAFIDPFRPGLRYAARSKEEFDLLTCQHLKKTKRAFERADVFIFTLGLTEAWMSVRDGMVFPACPGTISGKFDPGLHAFVNFDVMQNAADLNAFIKELREINPDVRIILSISPVPLAATATGNHVLLATTHSKAVLRVAAEHVVNANTGVFYFPAYEIITGPQAPACFFEPDHRNVSQDGVAAVMSVFLSSCESSAPAGRSVGDKLPGNSAEWSRAFAEVECEEVAADRP
ncbi:MAG TPA: GSCFA domain-containing protein [Xanthobacteraceae bacterium]|nr:GSCFA domain-containing protein [Xanthobacteraceae bacterium]